MPVFDYRQIGTGSLIAEDFYVQNVTLGNESKIIKAQSLKSFRMKNNVFSQVQPRKLSDTTAKFDRIIFPGPYRSIELYNRRYLYRKIGSRIHRTTRSLKLFESFK